MFTTRIDLTQLNNQTTELLNSLLLQKSQYKIQCFEKDKTYAVELFDSTTLQTHTVNVTLSHSVIQRPRNKDPSSKRFEIIDHNNLIGEGGFSKVYGVLATLSLDNNRAHFKKNKNRVVKIQTCSGAALSDIQNEVNISQKAETLHIKQPTIVKTKNDEYQCYMVMQRLNGTDLYSIINQMYVNALTLTTYQRLSIAMKMLQQLKLLHQKGIIHRDIKPDNLMLDLNTGELVIFDFGLSKMENIDDSYSMQGTPGYIPQEVYNSKGTSYKSDVFSMSVVIGLLFYADAPKQSKESTDDLSNYNFNNIFSDITIDLDQEEQSELLLTLKQMHNSERSRRFSTEQALTSLTNIREKYVNRKIDEMIKNRPPSYLQVNGLFIDKSNTHTESAISTHTTSCKF